MSADYSCSDCCSSSISKFPSPPPRKWEDCDNIGAKIAYITKKCLSTLSEFLIYVFNNPLTEGIRSFVVDHIFPSIGDAVNRIAKVIFIDILGEGFKLLRKGAYNLFDNQFTRPVYRFTVDRVFPFIGNAVNRLAKLIFIDIILEFCTYISDGIFNLLNNQVTRKLGNLALDYVICPVLDYTWFPFIDAVSEFFSVMYGGIDENPVPELEEAKSPRKESADSDSEGSEPDIVFVRNPVVTRK